MSRNLKEVKRSGERGFQTEEAASIIPKARMHLCEEQQEGWSGQNRESKQGNGSETQAFAKIVAFSLRCEATGVVEQSSNIVTLIFKSDV